MFCEHVGTHLSYRAIRHCELMLIMDPVPSDVILGLDLRMVDRIVHEVDG